MVKRRKNNTKKKRIGKGFKENGAKARKVNASTVFETCTEQLSPLGGLLPLILAEVYRGKPAGGLDPELYWNAEAEAKKAGIGVWSWGDKYVSPRKWRRMQKK